MKNDASITSLSAVQELTSLALREDNPYVQQWKEDGGKIAGFTCNYVPEELICAIEGSSPIMPFRMGAQDCESSEDAEIHLSKFSCGYAKCLLQLGLDGQYDFIDGIVWTSTCEQLRRTFEHWRDEVGLSFNQMISVPHVSTGENRRKWFAEELRNMVTALSKQYGGSINDAALRKSIKTFNTYRKLMSELYELRALDAPKLTGSEAMLITRASFSMPKETFNELLRRALIEMRARPGQTDIRARLMLTGSYADDTYLIDLIEETGAVVVTDTLCTGAKYFEGLVDEEIDPFEAIVDRYLSRISCPRMLDGYPQRLQFAKDQAAKAKVDGVILQRIPFCDNHAVENLMESEDLEKDSLPTLLLEREYLAADKGRLKTRIQEFLEKIGK